MRKQIRPTAKIDGEPYFMLYLCFLKRSRNYLRGFLIAAWAGAKITERSEQQYEIQELLFSPFAIAST